MSLDFTKVNYVDGSTIIEADNLNDIQDAILALDNNKVDAESGKGLSTEDYTSAEKAKLSGIEAGAQVNPGNATTSADGLMSSVDKAKLDGIATGATAVTIDNTLSIAGRAADAKATGDALAEKYEKPSSGIPKTDLAEDVQTSLGKADAALPASGGTMSGAIAMGGNRITGIANGTNDQDAVTKAQLDAAVVGALKPSGSIAFAFLPALSASVLNNIYNITDAFTTTSDFVEGSGMSYPAGTNVAVINTGTAADPVYKFDVYTGVIDLSAYRTAADQDVIDEAQDAAINEFYAPIIDSGSIVTFDAPADGLPIHKLTVQIEPVQSGSGDPSPDNVRPISGWTGCEVSRCGKNLFDKNKLNTGYYYDSDGRKFFDPEFLCTDFIRVSPGSTLVRNKIKAANMQSQQATFWSSWTFWDKEKKFISGIWNPETTCVMPENAAYLVLGTSQQFQNPDDFLADFQLEIGSVPTAFAPYTGTTIPITFPSEAGTVYGGTLTINDDWTGELVVDSAKIRLDALFYSYLSVQNMFRSNSTLMDAFTPSSGSPAIVSNIYKNGTPWTGQNNCACVGWPGTWDKYVLISDHRFTAPSDLRTYITESDAEMVYRITPITYQLTQQQVLDTLYGTNNIWADCGDVEVEHGAWLVALKGAINRTNSELSALRASIAPIEDGATASQAYAAGEFFFRNGQFCTALVQIASGAAFTLGTNYQTTTVAAAIIALQS